MRDTQKFSKILEGNLYIWKSTISIICFNMNIQNIIKIILAVLLCLCLADMPYGYYQFIRFISLIAFGYFAFEAYSNQKQGLMILFGSLALLFQPLVKISLGRQLWNIIDVVVAIILVVIVISENNNLKKK